MPAFRIPRARVEVEVSHLEAQGFRVCDVVVDGDDLIVFSPPLWRAREVECRPVDPPMRGGRQYLEMPEWRSEVSA